LSVFKYRITYPNFAFWSNFITLKWDEFSLEFHTKYSFDIPMNNNINLPKFRNNSNDEYFLFRNYYQIIDMITLDIDYLHYNQKLICLSLIYLLCGLFLRMYTLKEVVKEFAVNSQTYANFYVLNVIYSRFINVYLGYELDDIVDHLMYVSKFFNIKFDYSPPVIIKCEEDNNFGAVRFNYLT
jgi:hypothetical protein